MFIATSRSRICLLTFRGTRSSALRPLRRGLSTNTHSKSIKHPLFSFTSGGFLNNEEKEISLRYSPFNVAALEKVASKCLSAHRCTEFTKIGEGGYNKVFLLRFDNNKEAIARIPCPIIGNVERTVQSQVATMEYIREQWDTVEALPKLPKVLAWNASYSNPVESPYIVLEHVPGVPLTFRWRKIKGKPVKKILDSLLAMEKALLHQPFSQYGSIYFADDVSPELRDRPLYPPGQSLVYPPELSASDPPSSEYLSRKYKIGPTADRQWYRGAYADIDCDRGPWPDFSSYLKSAATFQLKAIDAGIGFGSPPPRSKKSDIPELRRLLGLCIRLAPLVFPDGDVSQPVLAHPDLGVANIIVPPEGSTSIQGLIDWEFSTVGPFFQQCSLPTFIQLTEKIGSVKLGFFPELPENYDEMSAEEKEFHDVELRLALRLSVYWVGCMRYEERWKAMDMTADVPIDHLGYWCTRCIADGPLSLRTPLIMIQQNWKKFVESSRIAAETPCPLDFTEEEIAAHEIELQNWNTYSQYSEMLFSYLRADETGSVDDEDAEWRKAEIEQCRKEWNEDEFKGPYPIVGEGYSHFLM